jgi:hypothetical protein
LGQSRQRYGNQYNANNDLSKITPELSHRACPRILNKKALANKSCRKPHRISILKVPVINNTNIVAVIVHAVRTILVSRYMDLKYSMGPNL